MARKGPTRAPKVIRSASGRRAEQKRNSGADLGTITKVEGYGFTGTRRHGNKRGADTKGQWQNSDGSQTGAWNQSAGYVCMIERDARWAA